MQSAKNEDCGCLIDDQQNDQNQINEINQNEINHDIVANDIHGITGGDDAQIDKLCDAMLRGGFTQNVDEKTESVEILDETLEGGKRRSRQSSGQKSKELLSSFEIADYGYKLDKSFEHLSRMIELYCQAIKRSMGEVQGSRDVADDVNFLMLGQSENRVRSLFIKWQQQVGQLISSCKTSVCKKNIQSISGQMTQLSKEILNQRIPNFMMEMQDISVTLNEYKKHFKEYETVKTAEPITRDINQTINTLLEASSDKKKMLLEEFLKYDQRLFERLQLECQTHYSPNSEQYKGFMHFMNLRKKTMQTFIYKLQEYENALKQDISKYKNNRPSEKQYTQLVRMYNELQDQLISTESGRAFLQNMDNIFTVRAQQRVTQELGPKIQQYKSLAFLPNGQNANIPADVLPITEYNIDIIYKEAFKSVYGIINNYTFLLRYCDATRLMTMQFHAQGFDIKRVIVDIIANWYLLLTFVPGEKRIYIRKFSQESEIPNDDNFVSESTQGEYNYFTQQLNNNEQALEKKIVPWVALTQTNAEYRFHNSLSTITYNCIKSLYGSFNLLIEYYLKKNKSLSAIITGGKRRRSQGQGRSQYNLEKPIAEALGFYKIIPEVWQTFIQSMSILTMENQNAEQNNINKRLFSSLQLYTSSRFYELYMYFHSNTYDVQRLVVICNQLWRQYSDSTSGGISARTKHICQDFIREMVENIVTKLYIGQTPAQLDDMSYIYNNIRNSSGSSLYLQSQFIQNNDVNMEMPVPEQPPTEIQSNIVDLYLQIVNLINQMIIDQPLNNFTSEDRESQYKQTIDKYIENRVSRYRQIQRDDQKQLYFMKFMSDPLLIDQTVVSTQTEFIKDVGTQLNQYTTLVGQIIKILINYHKKYVELSNYPMAVARALHVKLDRMPTSREKNIYELFINTASSSYSPEIQRIIVTYNQINTPNDLQLSKLDYDLINSNVLYTYILIKCLQMLEEKLIDNLRLNGGIKGGLLRNTQNNLIQTLIQNKIIQEYDREKGTYFEGNLPFSGNLNNQQQNASQVMYILTDEIFQYLQNNQPYLPNAYYLSYKQYSEMLGLLTSIPGVKVQAGSVNFGGMLQILNNKKGLLMRTIDKYKNDAANKELFEYVKNHISNGCDYNNFFTDTFRKYCPPPLPLQGFIQHNVKLNLFDATSWSYTFRSVYDTMGKIVYQYTLARQGQTDTKMGLLNVSGPFDLSSENYKSSLIVTVAKQVDGNQAVLNYQSMNIQHALIDQLNFYLSKTMYKLKQYNTALPTFFVNELKSNSQIQQALITSTVDFNGTIFNLPLNTLQTPFRCPILFGAGSQQRVGELANKAVQTNTIADRLRAEGCFLINDVMKQYIAITSGYGHYSKVPDNVKSVYKNKFDELVRTDIRNINVNIQQVYNKFFENVTQDKKQIFEQNQFNAAALEKTIIVLLAPGQLARILQEGADQFYDWYTNEPIDQYLDYPVSYVKVTSLTRNQYQEEYNKHPQQISEALRDTTNPKLLQAVSIVGEDVNLNRLVGTVILPVITEVPSGKHGGPVDPPERFNVIESSKFQALSEMYKNKFMNELQYSQVEMIYNKQSQKLEEFREPMGQLKFFFDQTNPVLYMSTVSMLYQTAPIEYSETQKYSLLWDMIQIMKQIKDFQEQLQNTTSTGVDQISSLTNTLMNAVRAVVNRCKDILKKPNISQNYNIKQLAEQQIFDPVLFTYYGNMQNAATIRDRYKKLYIQYVLGDKLDVNNINSSIIDSWFQINKLMKVIGGIRNGINFRENVFPLLQRAAFIKKRTPAHQIIGEDHYYIVQTNNSPLMIKRDQMYYSPNKIQYGWYHDFMVDNQGKPVQFASYISIYYPESFQIINDLNVINIADQPEWSNLLRFQYALLASVQNYQVQPLNIRQRVLGGANNNNYQQVNGLQNIQNKYQNIGLQQNNEKIQINNSIAQLILKIAQNLQRLYNMKDIKNATKNLRVQVFVLVNSINNQSYQQKSKTKIYVNLKALHRTLEVIPNKKNQNTLNLQNEILQQINQLKQQIDEQYENPEDIQQQQIEINEQQQQLNRLYEQQLAQVRDQDLDNFINDMQQQDQRHQQLNQRIAQEEERFQEHMRQINNNLQNIQQQPEAQVNQNELNDFTPVEGLAEVNGGIRYGILQNFINRLQQYLNDQGFIDYQQVPLDYDETELIISPLAFMQEITFFAGITSIDTLNAGRDIYCIESNPLENDIQPGNYLTFFDNTYQKFIKMQEGYNERQRNQYLQVDTQTGNISNSIDYLICTPIQFLFQVFTNDYSNIASKTINTIDARQILFKLLGVQPFNPISLIKQNLPYPLMTAMSTYIQTYERKYLGYMASGFGTGQQLLQLNLTFQGRPVFVITNMNNQPFDINGNSLDIIFDTQSGQNVYYTPLVGQNFDNVTLTDLRQRLSRANQNILATVRRDQLEEGQYGWYLRTLNGNTFKTSYTRANTSSDSIFVLQAIFTIIPKYFYYNSRLLKGQLYGTKITQTKYVVQANGEILQQPYKQERFYI